MWAELSFYNAHAQFFKPLGEHPRRGEHHQLIPWNTGTRHIESVPRYSPEVGNWNDPENFKNTLAHIFTLFAAFLSSSYQNTC